MSDFCALGRALDAFDWSEFHYYSINRYLIGQITIIVQ